MKEVIVKFEHIKRAIISKLDDEILTHDRQYIIVLDIVRTAYNRVQEDHINDGADYLFDINNTEHIKAALDRGMTIGKILDFWKRYQDGVITPYFAYNFEDKLSVFTEARLREHLTNWLDDIIVEVIRFPHLKEFSFLYIEFVQPQIDMQLGIEN